jgi:D-glycero-alpha-D-manno-heptose 1-phosphate guanylyltransferase
MLRADLVVLAGGLGTRLRAAVPDVPKPLAPVAGQPFLHHQLTNWLAQGVTSLTFLLQHRADTIEAFLNAERSSGRLRDIQMCTLIEPQPLGTGGSVANAVRELQLSGSFLVANADTWLGSGIAELCGCDETACMAVVEVDDSGRYGAVRLEDRGAVAAFEEKSERAGRGWINAGLYRLQADLFRDWNGQPFSLERELFPRLAAARGLTAVQLHAAFLDIGVPADYFRFNRWVESGRMGVP